MDIVDFVTLSLSPADLNTYGLYGNNDYCLYPDFNDSGDHPVPILITITNTYLAIRWEVPKLPDNCAGIVLIKLYHHYL